MGPRVVGDKALKDTKSDVSEPYRSDLARNAGVEVRKELDRVLTSPFR